MHIKTDSEAQRGRGWQEGKKNLWDYKFYAILCKEYFFKAFNLQIPILYKTEMKNNNKHNQNYKFIHLFCF